METEPEKKTEHGAIETYAEDMAKIIDDNKEKGLIKKIIHEEAAYEEEKKSLPPELKKNKFFMFAGILLIFLGLGTLSFFFFKKDINTVEVEKQFVPLIFTDQSTNLEVSGLKKDEIVQAVLNKVNTTKVKSGGIDGIYLTENNQTVGLRGFLSLTENNFVPGSNTTLISDSFLIGVMNNETKDFFILIKTQSLSDIFDSLRAWEGKMFSDLHGFFGIDISPETSYLLTENFEDGIIANKNARILYENDGQIAMMYVFADENSVIITDSETVAREIILRLAGSQAKQ